MNFVNVNAAAPGTGNAGRPLVLAGLTNVNSDINVFSPYGDTVYDGLQTSLQGPRPRRVRSMSPTRWSKTTNYADNAGGNAAGAGGPRIQYLPEKERNKGLAGYDRTHNLQVWGVYDLPFGRNGRWATEGAPAWIFGGWSVNAIWSAMSGTPIYIVQNTAFNLNAPGSQQIPDRLVDDVATFPDNLVGRPPAGDNGNGYQYFDRSAYAVVNIAAGQPQRFGTSPRNTLRGPGFWNVDLGLFRRVEFSRYSAQFRLEFLNVFNLHNYSNPGNNISDPATFGFITSTTGVGERNLRLGFRVDVLARLHSRHLEATLAGRIVYATQPGADLRLALALALAGLLQALPGGAAAVQSPRWVATWAASQQLVEPRNLPPAPAFTDTTIRQLVRVSIGGRQIRVRFSNAFGNAPLTLHGGAHRAPGESRRQRHSARHRSRADLCRPIVRHRFRSARWSSPTCSTSSWRRWPMSPSPFMCAARRRTSPAIRAPERRRSFRRVRRSRPGRCRRPCAWSVGTS